MQTKRLAFKLIAVVLFFAGMSGYKLLFPQVADTANLTDTRDTLETSRLSFHSSLEGGHTAGGSIITIDTTNHPSKSTANLHSGDQVYIGTSGSNPYTIADILNDSQFTITTGLAAEDDDDADPIYVKRTAKHTVTFTTASAIANGSFRIRIPVSSTVGADDDGIPDATGFDMNTITSGDLTAPNNGNGYTFGSPTLGIGGTGACASGYWCFNFPYTGSGGASIGFTGGTGMQFVIGSTNEIMNPSPSGTHTVGTADSYTVVVENLDAGGSAIDATTVAIGIIESVRVTATVEPSITFTVGARAVGTTACGFAANIASTAYSVPFGTMTLDTFKNASQSLTVSTNATSGYVVTAEEDDQLGKDGGTTPYIIDTVCNSSPCTHTTAQDWTSASSYPGFGYSLEEVTANAAAFEYDDSGTFYAKQFAAIADADVSQTIMSGSTTASSEQIYACFRLTVTSTQQAGDYENLITYVATGRF